ncbi:hypothetical protein Hdeb2414_s0009g00315681 [Helianthus debilis subsp. tardiflorus]
MSKKVPSTHKFESLVLISRDRINGAVWFSAHNGVEPLCDMTRRVHN